MLKIRVPGELVGIVVALLEFGIPSIQFEFTHSLLTEELNLAFEK